MIWNATTGGAYNNNIAGIGRDDAEGLNQKQSRSVNYNKIGQVVIALGSSVAVSNNANASTFSSDVSYLVWGDNGNNADTTTVSVKLTASYANFTYGSRSDLRRLKRVWQVQNTQVNQPVTLQFRSDSLGTTTYTSESSCARYVLLTSTDPTFATGVTVLPLNTNGLNYEVVNTFSAGVSYFTFGKIDSWADGLPYLTPSNQSTINQVNSCVQGDFTYYYASSDVAKANKLFAINWNGNIAPGGINGIININATPWSNTSGSDQCKVMGRILQMNPAGGNFTVNGGVKLRFYYSPSELNAASSGMTTTRWFKSELDIAALIASNNGKTVVGVAQSPFFGIENGVNYAEFSNITSFSSFGVAASTTATALPVVLKSIAASIGANCESIITWTAVTEINYDRYDVEYSNDGRVFNTVGSIKGQGNESKYSFVHRPVEQATKRFYRLKMIDKDGTYRYSAVVLANAECSIKVDPVILPNPATSDIKINNLGTGTKTIKIFTLEGKLIYTQRTIEPSSKINTGQWANGIYAVRIEFESGNIISRKLIKR